MKLALWLVTSAFAKKPAPPPPPPPGLVFPDEAFRKQRPEPGQAPSFSPPTPERFTLANGLDVYLVEDHALPVVQMDLVFDGGRAADPAGKEGLAGVCMDLVGDGTVELDKIAFSGALADLGASIRTSADADQQTVSLETLRKHLTPALDLFAGAVLRPGLRPDELDRVKKRRIEAVAQSKASAPSLANRLTSAVAYGTDHPLGRVSTEASLASVTLKDCQRFVKERARPSGARLFVAGDVTRADLEAELAHPFARWKGRPKGGVAVAAPAELPAGVFLVDIPGAPQSVVRLMHVGPARQAPDFVATELMASILGGGFSSRINMNIREAKGWAYGASGGYAYQRDFSLFSAGGSIRADATVDAVKEIALEIARMRTTDAAEAELARERDGALLSIPGRFATGGQILQRAQELRYYGLPLDWWSSYAPKVQATTLAELRAAAEAHLPEEVRILIVGDAASIAPKLAEAGLGPVVRLDADGRAIP